MMKRMMMGRRVLSCVCVLLALAPVTAFTLQQPTLFGIERPNHACLFAISSGPRRYGGPTANSNPNDPNAFDSRPSIPETGLQKKAEFRELLNQVMMVSDPQHIPSVLTKHMELLLNLSSQDSVETIDAILAEAKEEQGEQAAEQLEEVIDLVLSFTEDFVKQAVEIEGANKNVLGKIIRAISDKAVNERDREEALDELLTAERASFTPGFLRHIEGECERIEAAPTMTPESSRLLEILRVIQTRALEELGKELGQAAQVLGQLIGYESKVERMAVLEAGLAVQGVDFAREMGALTAEALEGFARVTGGVDPGLVECIGEIDERLQRFLENESKFE